MSNADLALRVAVILPCFNEEAEIAQTVQAFAAALPEAQIYVFDNGSTDRTIEIAREAGAIIGHETQPGKGNVIRRMFSDVEADIYVMADGDNTYDASAAPAMVSRLISGNLDMVNGARMSDEIHAYRAGHRFGNRMLTGLVQSLFSRRFGDMLSGYRVFSRRFVKSFPAVSRGFEIETELTVHALQLRMPVDEMPSKYAARSAGSSSKLSTYSDGFRILRMIAFLVKEERPLAFFLTVSGIVFLPSVIQFISVFTEFLETGLVERFPTLFVSLSGFVIAALAVVSALILDTVARGRREARHLAYLRYPGVSASLNGLAKNGHLDSSETSPRVSK